MKYIYVIICIVFTIGTPIALADKPYNLGTATASPSSLMAGQPFTASGCGWSNWIDVIERLNATTVSTTVRIPTTNGCFSSSEPTTVAGTYYVLVRNTNGAKLTYVQSNLVTAS